MVKFVVVNHVIKDILFNLSRLYIYYYDIDVEAIFTEVNMAKTKPIIIGNIYCPPDCTVGFLDKVDNVQNEITL